jgi:glycosyltransferase involved in cell wall biosynthesis
MKEAMQDNSDGGLNKVLMIKHVWGHHSHLGGSGVLCDYLPAPVLCASDWPWGDAPHGTRRWNAGRRLFDGIVLARGPFCRLIHFIHAENHPGALFRWLKRVNPKVKLLGTIHLPLDYYSLERSVAAFGHLDGIISLATWQVEEVRRRLPAVKVWHVPCGFDFEHPFRRPDREPPDSPLQVAVVGSNYRDWAMLAAVVDGARAGHPAWRFHLIGLPAARREEYRARPNAVVHGRLDDQEYFDTLARSHILLLPLTWATNNTAVLEAYSVGLPTLCSDLPAIRDYAVSTTRTFATAGQALEELRAVERQPRAERRAMRARTYAEGTQYDWRRIAERVRIVYGELLNA